MPAILSEKSIALRSNGRSHNVNVRVPKGIEAGKKLRLKGKGGQAPPGGIPGDLFLKVDITPHKNYERDGDNLRREHEDINNYERGMWRGSR